MPKSKTPRRLFLKNLKKGDEVWVIPSELGLWNDSDISAWTETFDGWFDFNGPNGEYCLLSCCYEGAFRIPTSHIFPTKKDAEIATAPKRIKVLKEKQKELAAEIKRIDKKIKKAKSLISKNPCLLNLKIL